MKSNILFSETQRFKQWWLWLILLGINGIFLFGVFKQVIGGLQWGNHPMSNTGLIVTAGFLILLTILFFNFRLQTQIKEDGIYVRFFPFHLSFLYYSWDTIAKAYVREYSPIREYGGWGLRSGAFGKGNAYNVSGNQGLQLEFTNGRKLLIGTNKPQELAALLTNMGQIKS